MHFVVSSFIDGKIFTVMRYIERNPITEEEPLKTLLCKINFSFIIFGSTLKNKPYFTLVL